MNLIKSLVCGLVLASVTQSVLADEVSLIDPQLSQFQNVYAYGEAALIDDVIEINSTDNFFTEQKNVQKLCT